MSRRFFVALCCALLLLGFGAIGIGPPTQVTCDVTVAGCAPCSGWGWYQRTDTSPDQFHVCTGDGDPGTKQELAMLSALHSVTGNTTRVLSAVLAPTPDEYDLCVMDATGNCDWKRAKTRVCFGVDGITVGRAMPQSGSWSNASQIFNAANADAWGWPFFDGPIALGRFCAKKREGFTDAGDVMHLFPVLVDSDYDPVAGSEILGVDGAGSNAREIVFSNFNGANANCTGSGTPAPCCTGSGAGTCAGAGSDDSQGGTDGDFHCIDLDYTSTLTHGLLAIEIDQYNDASANDPNADEVQACVDVVTDS